MSYDNFLLQRLRQKLRLIELQVELVKAVQRSPQIAMADGSVGVSEKRGHCWLIHGIMQGD